MGNRLSTSKPTKKEEVEKELGTSLSQKREKFMSNQSSTSNPINVEESKRMSIPSCSIPSCPRPISDELKINQPISNWTYVEEAVHPINTGQYDVHGELFNPYYKTLPDIDSEAETKPKVVFELEEQSTSNQPSTSNPTNVDEQGHPIGQRQYNVQGDLVIKQYCRPPPVDVSALATKPTTESLVQTEIKPTTACLPKTIGPKGGTIDVGGCALIVPVGALDEDVHITLTTSLDLDNQTKRILTPTLRCEPSSLEFKLPVTIFLQTHYILDEELLAECKIQTSDDGINWSILQTDLSYIGRTLVFTANHFTWYEGLLNWIIGKIDIVSSIYMRSETELVWAIHYNLDLNTEQPSGNCLAKFSHCIWANKNLTLTIEEDENPETIKIRPPSRKINHADLTTKFNQHTPFFVEELPDRSVYLNAILRNEDEPRGVLFKLQKQESTNQSTTSSNPSNNTGNTIQILQGVDAKYSALFSNNVDISGNKKM